MAKGRKTILSDDERKYFIENFPNTTNAQLASHLGLGQRTINRLAAQYHLVKSQQFYDELRIRSGKGVKVYYSLHPRPEGFCIPNSEKHQFRKGESIRTRQGDEAQRRATQKSIETRRITVQKEKRRILFGLPQRTKLRLHKQPRQKILLRYYLRSRGYIIDENKRIAYYTSSTKRGTRIERKQQPWYSFAPLPNK